MKCCAGVMTVTLHLPHSHSLKERRSVVNSVKERVRNKCNVSIHEEAGEGWQICNLAVACVADTESHVEHQFRTVREIMEQDTRLILLNPKIEYYV